MPRERVQHGKQFATWEGPGTNEVPGAIVTMPYHPGDRIPPDARVIEEPSLDVAWNRSAEWVQVGVELPARKVDDLASQAKTGDLPDEDRPVSVWLWLDVMSRQEINHLIRTLRRARDAAYGVDE